MSKKEERSTKITIDLKDYIDSQTEDKNSVGGFPIPLLFFLILLCIFGIIMTRPQSNQSPNQNNTVIIKE